MFSHKLLRQSCICLFALLPLEVNAELIQVLDTESYFVVITDRCEQGTLLCKKVEYYGIDKRSGKSKTLSGMSEVRYCMGDPPDTICEELGYVFKQGKLSVYVSRDAKLSIYQGDKTIYDARGTWVLEKGLNIFP